MGNEALAAEILAMADDDQRMRGAVAGKARPWDPSVDERNARPLRAIITEIGWPTTSKVGAQAEHMAWLLVQHAIWPTSRIASACGRVSRSAMGLNCSRAVTAGSRYRRWIQMT